MNSVRPRILLCPNVRAFGARDAGPVRRFASKPPSPPPSQASEAARKQTRLDRVISRLPGRLQRYLSPLRRAPLTHVTAFLILHELTAIVPLVGLAATFHYADWLPPYISEGAWVVQGVERFGRYFRRKGWITDEAVHEAEGEVAVEGGARDKLRRRAGTAWGWGEGGVRVLVEVATAWAVTKALLPLRLVVSVWGTPWFARVVLGSVGRGFKRVFGRGKKVASSTAGKS